MLKDSRVPLVDLHTTKIVCLLSIVTNAHLARKVHISNLQIFESSSLIECFFSQGVAECCSTGKQPLVNLNSGFFTFF